MPMLQKKPVGLRCTCRPDGHPCEACRLWDRWTRYLQRKREGNARHPVRQRAQRQRTWLRIKLDEARYARHLQRGKAWRQANPELARAVARATSRRYAAKMRDAKRAREDGG